MTQERRHLREDVSQMLKSADPKPSTSQDQPQDESVSEQPQGASATEQQPQGKATDTLSSQSSDDDKPLPDYAAALKTFMIKNPSSIPKKPRYSLQPKTDYI